MDSTLMEIYNNKAILSSLLRISKADTVRKLLPYILLVALYSLGIIYWELEILKPAENSPLRYFSAVHALLGFAISILLVFRTNTAYDRWWEGRKLWGALVNNSRNLALKINAFLPAESRSERAFFMKTIPFYAQVLKTHLQAESTRLALDEHLHPELHALDFHKHVPNQVAALMVGKIAELHKKGLVSGDVLIVLNAEMSAFTDICGACERIKNTPIPQSYSAFIKKFIFFYIASLPFGYVFTLGWFTAPLVCFVFYVLASLEIVAEEIEDPFGYDDNDLPMHKIAGNIAKHVAEILA